MKRKGGQVRIIGGLLRRTPVVVAGDVAQIRPTPDRVRETLFNWLGERVVGAACLDLFAGSGVLGLEAASRGAQSVLFVEKQAQAQTALNRQIEHLRAAKDPAVKSLAQRLSVASGDAMQQLGRLSARAGRFDLVFLDPPFAQDWRKRLTSALPAVLNDDALVYYESATELVSLSDELNSDGPVDGAHGPQGEFRRLRHDRAGQVHYHLFSYHLGKVL